MICVPVVAKTNETAIAQMNEYGPLADVVELRIDFIKNADPEKLLSAKKGKVIVTARKKDEGGNFEGSEEERLALLKKAIASKADFVDVELNAGEAFVKEIQKEIKKYSGKTKLIISYHNFDKTPGESELQEILDECSARGADIVKIVTFANSVEDNLEILKLIVRAKETDREIIAMCMGNYGRISRIAAPYFGSCICFASSGEGAESAPGQLTLKEMKEILGILKNE